MCFDLVNLNRVENVHWVDINPFKIDVDRRWEVDDARLMGIIKRQIGLGHEEGNGKIA